MKTKKIGMIAIILLFIMNLAYLPAIRAESFLGKFERGVEQEIGYYNYQSLIRQKSPARLKPAQAKRIQRIFEQLVAQSSRSDEVEYTLTIVEDPAINAFAVPGGYIFVNTGLIDFAQSDGEIAGVIGHEIAHIDRKHTMKSLYRTVGMSALWNLAMYKNDSSYKEVLNRVAGVSMTLIQLGYSREAEFEADAYGVRMMTAAGYSKNELLNFWKRVDAQSGNELPSIFQMFSTHPPVKERIAAIEEI